MSTTAQKPGEKKWKIVVSGSYTTHKLIQYHLKVDGKLKIYDINPKAVAKITKHRFIPNKLTKEIIWTHKNIQLL